MDELNMKKETELLLDMVWENEDWSTTVKRAMIREFLHAKMGR